jgi:hypothetical protein
METPMRHPRPTLVLPLLLVAGLAWGDGDQPVNPPAPATAAAAARDVIVLKSGGRLEGEIIAEDDANVSLKSGGVTRAYARDTIASIERAPRAATPAPATDAPGAAPSPPPDAGNAKKGKGDRRDAPLSDAAKKWLDELVARSADADESVRRSIGAAIGALGPQVVPVLRAAAAAAAEGPQKQFLDRLAADIEQRDARREGMGPGGPMGPRGGAARRGLEEMMQRLTTELELTDDERPKVEAILADWGRKRFEAFGQARRDGLSPEQMQEKVAELRTEVMTQMKGVLTEPQYLLLEAAAERLFAMQPRGPQPPRPEAPKPADPPK